MYRFRTSKLMPLAAMLAMVVQLCVVAFHHHGTSDHGTIGAADIGNGHAVHALFEATHDAGHEAVHEAGQGHHDHYHSNVSDDAHHGPEDSDGHDCASCVLISALSSQLTPDSVATLRAPTRVTKRRLTASKTTLIHKIARRYQARAPPVQAAIS